MVHWTCSHGPVAVALKIEELNDGDDWRMLDVELEPNYLDRMLEKWSKRTLPMKPAWWQGWGSPFIFGIEMIMESETLPWSPFKELRLCRNFAWKRDSPTESMDCGKIISTSFIGYQESETGRSSWRHPQSRILSTELGKPVEIIMKKDTNI